MSAPWHESEQPPCFCELESSQPLITQEYCPAHGDPSKPAMDLPPAMRYAFSCFYCEDSGSCSGQCEATP